VQQAILLVFRKFMELGTVRQTLMWFLEHVPQVPTRNARGETFWKRPVYRSMHRRLTVSVRATHGCTKMNAIAPANLRKRLPTHFVWRSGCEWINGCVLRVAFILQFPR
jgi:hypothetical protein